MKEFLIVCKNCNAEIDGNAGFCPKCGVKVGKKNICSGCGAILEGNTKFCSNCGTQVGKKNQVRKLNDNKLVKPQFNKIELNSIEETEAFLSNLQSTASNSVAEALKAQLTVIRYIKSPSLIDTTFDTLLLNLNKSLKYAETPQMKDMIREKFSLMIQNYIFFFDARMQFEIDSNNKESLEMAGEMLSQSVVGLIQIAYLGGNAVDPIVRNFLKPDAQGKSLLTRIINWWKQSQIIAEKTNEFNETLDNLFIKLEQYAELIGPSMLIYGLIERYTEQLTNHKTAYLLDTVSEENEKVEEYLKKFKALFPEVSTFGLVLGCIIFPIVILVLVLIFGVLVYFYYKPILITIGSIIVLFKFIYLIKYLHHKSRYNRLLKNYYATWNEIYNSGKDLAMRYKEI